MIATIAQEWAGLNSELQLQEIDPEKLALSRHTFYLGVQTMMSKAQQANRLAQTDPKAAADLMNGMVKELTDYFQSVDVPAEEPSRIIVPS